MLDKRNQKYFDYLVKLQVDRFTGKIEFNFFNGIIANLNKETNPLEGVTKRETVKLG